MRIKLDTNPDGFLRADSANARRFVGPKLGPAATMTMAALVELADKLGGTVDVDPAEVAARVGLSPKGLERALQRLEAFDVVTRDGDGLTVREWIDVPTAAWREKAYPAELAAEFKMLIDSVIAAGPDIEVDTEPDGVSQPALGLAL